MINNKFIFWGTGKVAQNFISQHGSFMKAVKIVGFTDNDKEKWDTLWEGYTVLCPDMILQKNYDYILIMSVYFDEIRDGILAKYLVNPERILSIDEACQMYVRKVHGVENGRKFGSYSLISEISFSKQMYDKTLDNMDNMFSYLYIRDRYKAYIEKLKKEFSVNIIQNPIRVSKEHVHIWICWLQGLENAPDIVRYCVNSIVANVVGKIHIITYDNYADYIELNEHIVEKHKLGIIDRTHFSDIIRLALLYKYGGIWMDATILMMDTGLPDYIYELPIFMYRIRKTLDMGYPDPRLFTNWFIKCEKGNTFLEMIYKLHEEWWNTENEIPYFFFHYVVRMVWEVYGNIFTLDAKRLNIHDDNCRVLAGMMNEKYDEVFWNILKDEQPLQKLSRKLDYKKEGTFYGYISERYGEFHI